jgi:hypothetical protein
VLEVVRDQQWFDTTAAHEKSIYLSQGASLWMVLSRGGRPDTFVKFSALVSLETEARRAEQASRAYDRHAPTFLGYARRGALEVLATRALDFRPVTAGVLRSRRDADAVSIGLEAFFSRMRANAGQPPAGPRRWLNDLAAYFDGHALRAQAQKILPLLTDAADRWPAMPQHGDLVMNNLGLERDGRLVLFDWEDFGALDLPGLDLFTAEYSFSAETASDAGRPDRPRAVPDVARCCRALGIDCLRYQQLRPAYALAFRYIKRNYGPEVQARLDRLIVAATGGP